MPDSASTDFASAVARVLDNTKPGDVLTYGEVAAEAGFPGASRAVGTYLKRSTGHPWWRIVNAAGRLAPGNEVRQAAVLRNEGVEVRNGKVRFR